MFYIIIDGVEYAATSDYYAAFALLDEGISVWGFEHEAYIEWRE